MVKLASPALVVVGLSLAVRSFNITSGTPRQCSSLQISWTGSAAAQLKFPLSITVLPFASTAVISPVSIHTWNASTISGSLAVPFILRGGTQFLFAVTDSDGKGVGPVSEIKTAADSQDASCLDTQASPPPAHFQVHTTPDRASCPSLNVSWDDTVKRVRPKILAFSPGMLPVDLDPSVAAAPLNRVVTSHGTFTSKSQVVVLFDDKSSPAQTSELLTVGGMDSANCSPSATGAGATGSPTHSAGETMLSSASRATNNGAVIIGAVVAAVVSVAAIFFAVAAYRQRRMRSAGGLILHSRSSSSSTRMLNFGALSLAPESLPSPRPPPVPPKSPWATFSSSPPHKADNSRPPLSPHRPPPTPLPTSPLARASRRRSFLTSPSSVASSYQQINFSDAEYGRRDTIPDSATLPDPLFLQQSAQPRTPITPRSARLARYATRDDAAPLTPGAPSSNWSKKVH